MKFFPPEAFFILTPMSDKALVYSKEPLAHRTLVLFEAAGIPSEMCNVLLRTLSSEHKIRYEVVMPNKETRLIERRGLTGLIQTTTAERLHLENETRMLSLKVDDSRAHTRNVLLAVASDKKLTRFGTR